EGLARAGDAEQDLVAFALPRLGDELGDGGGLVAGGRVLRLQPEGDAPALVRAVGAVRRPAGGGAGGLLGRQARAGDRGEHRHVRRLRRALGGAALVVAQEGGGRLGQLTGDVDGLLRAGRGALGRTGTVHERSLGGGAGLRQSTRRRAAGC